MFFKDYEPAFRKLFDLSSVRLKDISHHNGLDSDPKPVERDIVDFYMILEILNGELPSGYSLVDHRKADLIKKSDEVLGNILARMINYLTAVCIRECRHYKKTVPTASSEWNGKVDEIKGNDGTSAVKLFYKIMADMSLHDVLDGAVNCFYNGGWGSSFGGKKWGAIADHTLKFVKGEISVEVFIDQAFSLQHNTSSVFNKHVIYQYNGDSRVFALLELQSEGAIRKALKEYGTPSFFAWVEEHYPEYMEYRDSGDASKVKEACMTLGLSYGGAEPKGILGNHEFKIYKYTEATAEEKKIKIFGAQVSVHKPVRGESPSKVLKTTSLLV